MDWNDRMWIDEDRLFAPKRQVNNHNRTYKNIIGRFYSWKMKRAVEYESLAERLYYFYLELDPSTIRYYVQPIEILVSKHDYSIDSDFYHIPDVLVFRNGHLPFLVQVKHRQGETSLETHIKNCACENFSKEQDWTYHIVTPDNLPPVLRRNIRLLRSYIAPRPYYPSMVDEVVYRLSCMTETTVRTLARYFDGPKVLSCIYHLMALGVLYFDVTKEVGPTSLISINTEMSRSHGALVSGGYDFEL